MYEKHIEDLMFLLEDQGNCHSALRAAITLMRAAEPKDPDAERVRVEKAVSDICSYDLSEEYVIERERAAVRAECAGKISRLQTELGRMSSYARRAARQLGWTIEFSLETDLESKLAAPREAAKVAEDALRKFDVLDEAVPK